MSFVTIHYCVLKYIEMHLAMWLPFGSHMAKCISHWPAVECRTPACAARPPAVLQTTDTSEQKNAGPLGGPVIIIQFYFNISESKTGLLLHCGP